MIKNYGRLFFSTLFGLMKIDGLQRVGTSSIVFIMQAVTASLNLNYLIHGKNRGTIVYILNNT